MKNLPDWIPIVLRFAGITNAVWGLTFALFTDVMLRWAGMPPPHVLFSWKIIALIAVIFGAAYYLAASDPVRHVLIISVGLFIKLTGAVMLVSYYFSDVITARLASFIALKDVPWSIVFGIILYHIFKAWQTPDDHENNQLPLSDTLKKFSTQDGDSLHDLSFRQPVYLVFLRHFGCIFCREAMADIQRQRQKIEAEGVEIVFVHMGTSIEGEIFFAKYGFDKVSHISDPACLLYRTFQLKRDSFRQFFGIHSWIRGFKAGVLKTYGIGWLVENGFRMSGVFVIYRGEMLKSYRLAYASDRPDYVGLASCELV